MPSNDRKRAALPAKVRKTLRSTLTWNKKGGFDVEVIFGPTDERPDDRWRIRVKKGDLSVILDEPPRGCIRLDTGRRGKGGRPSTGESDLNDAIVFAEEWLAELDLARLANSGVKGAAERAGDTITIGEVQQLAPQTYLRQKSNWPHYRRAADLGVAVFGENYAVAKLDSGEFRTAIERIVAGDIDLPVRHKIGHATALARMRDLVTLLKAVGDLRLDGMRLCKRHPSLGERGKRDSRFVWPSPRLNKEYRKRRREPMNPEAFPWLVEPVKRVNEHGTIEWLPCPADQADPSGMLRVVLTIVYRTGRRIQQVLRLRVEDYIRDRELMREVLREAHEYNQGICHSAWAADWRTMTNFRPDDDKEGYHFPVPNHRDVEEELDRHIARHNLQSGWLFPSSRAEGRPVAYNTMVNNPHYIRSGKRAGELKPGGRFDRAVYLACVAMEAAGEDPRSVFPVERRKDHGEHLPDWMRWRIRKGYKLHRFRGCHATEMERLLWGSLDNGSLNGHACYIGGWEPAGKSVRDDRYRDLDGEVMQGCADWKTAAEATANVARMSKTTSARSSEALRRSRELVAQRAAAGAA